MKSKILKIPLWGLTIFMALVAIVYFPSIASIFAALFVVICAPIKKLEGFFKSKHLNGFIKGVLLVILFFAAIFAAPEKQEDTGPIENDLIQQVEQSETRQPENETYIQETGTDDQQEPSGIEADGPEEVIKSILLKAYSENQISSLTIDNGNLEIRITMDCSSQNRPDDWSDITSTAQLICSQVVDSKENTCQNTAVRILGRGDKNLLNVLNGEITYDCFAKQEEENLQEGTYSNGKPVSSNSRDYVLNTNTMKFHYPSCSSVSDIKAENRENYSGSRDTLISRGYSSCGRCHP